MPSPLGLVNNSSKYTYSPKNAATRSAISSNTVGDENENGQYTSIFNGNKFYYRPTASSDGGKSSKSRSVHGSGSSGGRNDIYNTTTSSIIDYTANTAMELGEQDFAYLKDYGVYPNNRLIVVRRFKSPVGDDLTSLDDGNKPISTLVSWFEGEKSPLKISFGEKWENGQGNLVKLLDRMLGTEKLGGGLRTLNSFFQGGVPFSGFSEGLQFELLKRLGLTDDKGLQNVPSGNPNLIQESKKRQLVNDSGGSAMETKIDIDFETTYQQKFIGGTDPTLVYLDIINNILRFGGSESNFYINGKGGELIRSFLTKFRKGQWIQALTIIVNAIVDLMSGIVESLFKSIKKVSSAVASAAKGDTDPITSIVTDAFSKIGGAVISKYRVEIGGIVSSLTGESSTPWHVTIGNPKSPIFSTGDMYTQNVTIELGPVLAFNDLPSSITVTCTLSNARSLGIQEIFGKFNAGKGRSYQVVKNSRSVLETPVNEDDVKEILNTTNKEATEGAEGLQSDVEKQTEEAINKNNANGGGDGDGGGGTTDAEQQEDPNL